MLEEKLILCGEGEDCGDKEEETPAEEEATE